MALQSFELPSLHEGVPIFFANDWNATRSDDASQTAETGPCDGLDGTWLHD